MHTPMEEMEVFKAFEEVSDHVWEMVGGWTPFAKDTVGKQVVRSADSVGANLVEGDGRYGKADALHFFVIARGSARETALWIKRAVKRRLLTPTESEALQANLQKGMRMLNNLITFRRQQFQSPNAEPKSAASKGPTQI